MTPRRVLTGITTTGTPHLGNYVGAIRPAIQSSRSDQVEGYFFLADFHSLIKNQAPERIHRSTLEIAATWLALGLDPARVHFYRQSDIPEIPELTWMLGCVAAKGLLNRAHAYKAAADANRDRGDDPDAGVSMGLYSYPVLMAADILIFGAQQVPVGRDQVQHIEMARDMAQRMNHLYGQGQSLLVLPEAVVDEQVATLPGLDGRKMSKSYDNTIPLWLPRKALKKAIDGIVTNSLLPGEAKDPDGSHLFQIYAAFANTTQRDAMAEDLRAGLGWGEAKSRVFALIDEELGEARSRYEALIAHPEKIEQTLQDGAARVRPIGQECLRRVRQAVGLRPLQAAAIQAKSSAAKTKLPRLVSYSEDGRFNFKLTDASGVVLLLGSGFDSPVQSGQTIKYLRNSGSDESLWARNDDAWSLPGPVGQIVASSSADCDHDLSRILEALAQLQA